MEGALSASVDIKWYAQLVTFPQGIQTTFPNLVPSDVLD